MSVTLSSKHNGANVVMIDAAQKQFWDQHPLVLNGAQQRAAGFDQVVPVLEGQDFSPSKLLGIPKSQIVGEVQRMNKAFKKAKLKYKDDLAHAEGADLKEIQAMNKEYDGGIDHCMAWFWKIWGWKYISQSDFDARAQAHRYAWIVKVSTLEKQRIDGVKAEVRRLLPPVVAELEKLEKDGQTDVNLQAKAWQLRKLLHVLSPKEGLPQDGALGRLLPPDQQMIKAITDLATDTLKLITG